MKQCSSKCQKTILLGWGFLFASWSAVGVLDFKIVFFLNIVTDCYFICIHGVEQRLIFEWRKIFIFLNSQIFTVTFSLSQGSTQNGAHVGTNKNLCYLFIVEEKLEPCMFDYSASTVSSSTFQYGIRKGKEWRGKKRKIKHKIHIKHVWFSYQHRRVKLCTIIFT